ncbi:DUF6233 domain-containing protein [Streptomyces natalensis]|uniref:DUF6233 domain-containing protein n=1 Tax=Streptomyces natalensis TaxID=68242 RepID=UPI0005C93DFB|nr:DUF6233 domain-containing protein [Streptomyces natalensis]
MDDAREDPQGASAPRAEVTLPDGQRLTAPVTRRRRDRSGTWWYDLQIELPDRSEDRRHGPTLTSRTITICAPHPVVQPIPGEDYSSLDPPPPEKRKQWRLSPPPAQDSRADAYLHRLDCAQAQSAGGMLTDREALAALAGPDVTVPCPVCRPDAVLRHRR